MRSLSLTMRRAISGSESGEIAVVLLTISHPSLAEPIRLSSDPTARISDVPLRYGTISRSQTYTFFPFVFQWPDDVGERAPVATIQLENVSRELIALIRSADSRATVSMELVLASSPSIVEQACPIFDLNNVSYNADTISLELSMDSYSTEPYPAGRFNPAGFPGLF